LLLMCRVSQNIFARRNFRSRHCRLNSKSTWIFPKEQNRLKAQLILISLASRSEPCCRSGKRGSR
jgi:hypothetical protein